VGDDGFVHAFEPNPEMCDLIERALIRNQVNNVHLYHTALGSQAGELTLSIPSGNLGGASLNPTRRIPGSRTMVVPVRPLSSIIADQKIDHIRLMKLDVEGFEPEVLQGAAELFRRRPPDLVLFELNDYPVQDLRGLHDHATIQLLSQFGYGFFRLPVERFVRMCAFPLDLRNINGKARSRDFVAARLGPVYDSTAELLGVI